MGWWFFTRSAIDALTRPAADIEACDRAIEDLARDSVIGGALHGASRGVRHAWLDSRARRAAIGVARYLTPAPEAAALRLRGWITVVAGITVLALNAVKPVPLGPLSWLLPSVAIAAALLAMCTAAPLARAIAERRARRGKVVAR